MCPVPIGNHMTPSQVPEVLMKTKRWLRAVCAAASNCGFTPSMNPMRRSYRTASNAHTTTPTHGREMADSTWLIPMALARMMAGLTGVGANFTASSQPIVSEARRECAASLCQWG